MSSRPPRSRSLSGGMALLIALAVGVAGGMLAIVPVESQALTLEALRAPASVPVDEPWASVWDGAPKQDVPLSAQNIAPPFGGGTVQTLTARALHDGSRLYFLLEWSDAEPNDTVNGFEEFADAAAVQFPGDASKLTPPFTMGGPDAPVNIWQWTAVWQADIERGFDTTMTRYPNTYADFYPDPTDTLFKPALYVGNPLAQRDHDSPIESAIAAGFGTLTHADVQDVIGAGEWRDGRWRALFVRQFEPAADGRAGFAEGETTSVAFAVWDGGSDDRNGQKSIAPLIELTIGAGEASAVAADEGGGAGWLIAIVMAIVAVAVGVYIYTVRQQSRTG